MNDFAFINHFFHKRIGVIATGAETLRQIQKQKGVNFIASHTDHVSRKKNKKKSIKFVYNLQRNTRKYFFSIIE